MNNPLSQAGFTLLELIVVMVLMSVLLGFAIPGLSNRLFTSDTRRTINWFVKALPDLKSSARLSGRDIELCFDLSAQTLSSRFLETNSTAADPEKPIMKLPQGFTLPEGVRIIDVLSQKTFEENTSPCLVIRAAGYCDEAIIHITDDDGDFYSCRIQPFLSEVRVYDQRIDFQ